MTTKIVPRICDFCGHDISSEMKYKLQISQRGDKKKKGESLSFVKANNDADMCHECFLKIGRNGYKPDWVTLEKNTDGKWVTLS